jgi:hypothetical protein
VDSKRNFTLIFFFYSQTLLTLLTTYFIFSDQCSATTTISCGHHSELTTIHQSRAFTRSRSQKRYKSLLYRDECVVVTIVVVFVLVVGVVADIIFLLCKADTFANTSVRRSNTVR